MNVIIIIKQIFLNCDLRAGENMLTRLMEQASPSIKRNNLARDEVVLFMNRKRNIIKVLGNKGMFVDHKDGYKTFDFKLRRDEIFKSIGHYFGIELHAPEKVFKTIEQERKHVLK